MSFLLSINFPKSVKISKKSLDETRIYRPSIKRKPVSSFAILKLDKRRIDLSSFYNGPTPASFCLFLILFNDKFDRKNCRLLRDSNLDRRSRRRARWPLDHHHGLILVLIVSNLVSVTRCLDYFSVFEHFRKQPYSEYHQIKLPRNWHYLSSFHFLRSYFLAEPRTSVTRYLDYYFIIWSFNTNLPNRIFT